MSSALEVRNFIVDFLRRELIGPDPGFPAIQINHEEILRPQDPPRYRYGAGIFFPMKAQRIQQDDSGQDITQEESGEDEAETAASKQDVSSEDAPETFEELPPETEQEVNLANEFLPSAMGVSALIDMPAILRIRVFAGEYENLELPGWQQKSSKAAQKGWWRRSLDVPDLEIDGSRLCGDATVSYEQPIVSRNRPTGLSVNIVSRPYGPKNTTRLLTVSLVNRRVATEQAPKNEDCFFQCGFEIEGSTGGPCFLEYPERPDHDQSEEELSLRLLYRHRKIFAVGHGCAADWGKRAEGGVNSVRTESLPTYEIKPVLPVEISGLKLSMNTLAGSGNSAALRLCSALADSYEDWIQRNEKLVSIDHELSEELRKTAERHLASCRACLARIRAGIDILMVDDEARAAFGLMNRAMLLQQLHYQLSSKPRKWVAEKGTITLETKFVPPAHDDDSRAWRPFQLAFVLMNIRAFAQPECDDRDLVDLIWFPTGGGKTEAYLGLSAFAMFLRRLRDPANGGTTVLMRYTLRLLTTQQFQRAASLICACEHLRRTCGAALGAEPFTIGLWVGGDVTPNSNSQAAIALNNLLNGQSENKFIVLSCPWCGAAMGPVDCGRQYRCPGYDREGHPASIKFRCGDKDCPFSTDAGLPLKVIDEEIYGAPPTLLIGTVDKFAMLPWLPNSRHIFGIDVENAKSPPDLIIQDELHLISGPLGSMVGHYETVIDELCTKRDSTGKLAAKIVASTATISRADDQIRSLYGRDAFLFPPQGLKVGESFFAEEREHEVGRLYLGILASALPSHVTAQVRVMSALLQAVKLAPTDEPKFLDPYWTMMAYFNSRRELGHAATLIQADIREYLNAVWDRMGLTFDMGGAEARNRRRFVNRDIELTGRIPSSSVPAILQELFDAYEGKTSTDAVDVCFATNMIQVGLDVPRLSLMTIVGQPKTTSEYIQASSRVGRARELPGLVVTNFNPFKPRDRSHFEHFRAYHESIYRYVEPTSVTPFAIPVRERALHALVVTLARFWGGDRIRANPTSPPDQKLEKRIRAVILDRVSLVDEDEEPETARLLDELFERWERILPPKYGGFGAPTEELQLMYPAGSQMHPLWHEEPWATPSSMRNVDSDCEARPIGIYPTPI